MNSLPYEIVVKILEYLDLNSRIDLRMTNRKLRAIVDDQRIDNLRITDSNVEILENYFLTSDPVMNSDVFLMTSSDYFNSFILKSIVRKVKRSYIDLRRTGKSINVLSIINRFENLEQLQCPYLLLRYENIALKLPKLKILSIESVCHLSRPLEIDAPVLESFKTKSSISFFNFLYPDSLVHISLENLDQHLIFEKFRNIEFFYLKNGSIFSLESFPKLSEFHFSKIINENLLHLFEQKSLGGLKIEFFFNGIKIDAISELMSINLFDSCGTYIDKILDNYKKTSKVLPWISEIDYSILAMNSNNLKTVPSNFFSKLINVKEISVNHNVEEKPFNKFIQNCKHLEKLDISASFSQCFYDYLVFYSPLLSIIHINESNEIDMQFLSRFMNLQEVKYNKHIPLVTIMNIFQQVIFMIEFEFMFKNKYFSSIKVDESNCEDYYVELGNEMAIFHSKDAMCNFFKKLAFFV